MDANTSEVKERAKQLAKELPTIHNREAWAIQKACGRFLYPSLTNTNAIYPIEAEAGVTEELVQACMRKIHQLGLIEHLNLTSWAAYESGWVRLDRMTAQRMQELDEKIRNTFDQINRTIFR